HAGCGVNALSGLQKTANSRYCRIRVGLISTAHQAIFLLAKKRPAKRASDRGQCALCHAGCGVNALSGLQKTANSRYCRIRVGLISTAHQAIFLLAKKDPQSGP
ncbi:hypothetical protein, partial [Escherichia albertii]